MLFDPRHHPDHDGHTSTLISAAWTAPRDGEPPPSCSQLVRRTWYCSSFRGESPACFQALDPVPREAPATRHDYFELDLAVLDYRRSASVLGCDDRPRRRVSFPTLAGAATMWTACATDLHQSLPPPKGLMMRDGKANGRMAPMMPESLHCGRADARAEESLPPVHLFHDWT